MSSLSEAEKRRILRERRAAKFLQGGGGSRLDKITGINNSKLSTSSPIDSNPASASLSPEPTPVATPTPLLRSTSSFTHNSKRISQTFSAVPPLASTSVDLDADPEVSDLSSLQLHANPLLDPVAENGNASAAHQQPPSGDELEQLIHQMLSGAAPASGSLQGDPFGGEDIFLNLMASMQQAQGQPGTSTASDLQQEDIFSLFGANLGASQENIAEFENFKYKFILFRVSILTSLLFYFYYKFELTASFSSFIQKNPAAKQFHYYFLLLEALFFMIHFFNIQKYDYHPGGGQLGMVVSLLSQFLAPRIVNVIRLVPGYLDIYKILQIDISVVILFFGLVCLVK